MDTIGIIPFIGEWQQGVDYDLTVAENTLHRGTLTRNPVEDGQLSYVNDHNRDEPAQVTAVFAVSTVVPSGPNKGQIDVLRPGEFHRDLLDLKARQVVDPTELLDFYTGTIVLNNMAIISVQSARRVGNSSQKVEIAVTFEEMRFADQPERSFLQIGTRVGSGARNIATADRPILEGTNVRRVRGAEYDLGIESDTESGFESFATPVPQSILRQLLAIF